MTILASGPRPLIPLGRVSTISMGCTDELDDGHPTTVVLGTQPPGLKTRGVTDTDRPISSRIYRCFSDPLCPAWQLTAAHYILRPWNSNY